jgi:hypothetical protein
MEDAMRAALRVSALIAVFVLALSPRLAPAQPAPPPSQQQPAFTPGELVNAGPFDGRARSAHACRRLFTFASRELRLFNGPLALGFLSHLGYPSA